MPLEPISEGADHRIVALLRRRLAARERAYAAAVEEVEGLRSARHREAARVREIDHRAKNSLQLAAAMLRLQGRWAHPQVARTLEEAAGRLEVLAEIHRTLYQSAGPERIAAETWLRAVCDGLRLRPDVDISLTCCAAVWPVEVAAPVALFVNEAVSNALKHAFRTRGGRIEVTVAAASDDGQYRVGVADDGDGFSDETREGLGSHLMRGFARQLKGRLSRSARPFGPGAELVILFRP